MEVKALQQMLMQFRQMQESLQKQVETVHVDASAGGGMVAVKMNGSGSVCRQGSRVPAGFGARVRERSQPSRG